MARNLYNANMAFESMRKKRSQLLKKQDMEDRSGEFCRMIKEADESEYSLGEYRQNLLLEELKFIIKDPSVFPCEADAMLFALKNNQFAVVECLHERMAVNIHEAKFADGKSVLHWLVKQKCVEPHKTYLANAMLIIDYLLANARKNYQDGQGFTYFHGACMIGDRQTVERFISTLGEGVCNLDTYTLSPLYIAAKCGRVDVVRRLLLRGANPNWYDRRQGSRILHGLARLRRCDCPEYCWPLTDPDYAPRPVELIVDALIGHGARIDERNVGGLTPLEWAVSRLDYSLTRAFLRHGASSRTLNENISLNVKDYTKHELMFYPVALYVPEMMELLTTNGFRMNSLGRSKFLIFWSEAAKHEMDDTQSLVSTKEDITSWNVWDLRDLRTMKLRLDLHHHHQFFLLPEAVDRLAEKLSRPRETVSITQIPRLPIIQTLDCFMVNEYVSLLKICQMSYVQASSILKNSSYWRLPHLTDDKITRDIVKRHIANVLIIPHLELLLDHCKLSVPRTQFELLLDNFKLCSLASLMSAPRTVQLSVGNSIKDEDLDRLREDLNRLCERPNIRKKAISFIRSYYIFVISLMIGMIFIYINN